METVTRTLLYDRDYYLWLETTSQLLRNRQLDRIDLEHLAEELEDDEFPELCPFSIDQTLNSDYWPENEV